MSRQSQVTLSDFYCTKCGKKGIPIARKIGSQREPGHLKRLYCIFCGEEVNHAEIRPFGEYKYDDFKLEFDLGRFVDGNKVAVADLLSCSHTDCKYNINGKCWNSQETYDCGHRIINKGGNNNG